jgi:hypothetical protein
MPSASRDQYATTQTATTTRPEASSDSRGARTRTWVNWTLALLTVPAAVGVVLFGLGVFMSYAACSDQHCPPRAPSGIWLEAVWFGSPVVAGLAIVISFFTARRRHGIVVPLCAWALLVADVALLASYTQP